MTTILRHDPTGTWFLQGATSSYVLRVEPSGHLTHLHWGPRVEPGAIDWFTPTFDRAFCINEPGGRDSGFALDTLSREAPTGGNGDFRAPMLGVVNADGSHILDLRVVAQEIHAGKPRLDGLPATYVEREAEADTLVLTLADRSSGAEVVLHYTVFRDSDAIARSWRLTNRGSGSLRLTRALSASLDLPHCNWTLLQLSGAWARERQVVTHALVPGISSVESRRGTSSHQHNPFLALLAPGTTEEHGEVLAVNLVYSGNFLAQAEVDQYGHTRLQIGINPHEFTWELTPGATFQAPEAVLVRSGEGLGGMSRAYHRLYRSRLVRGPFRDAPRPVLINNWEATYFNFDTEKLLRLAAAGAEVGCDLFVLDDGWFGKREGDRSGLGDWTTVNLAKLPGGLQRLAEGVNALGLRFGLWFEPEMVSPDSDLYRAHPDWCLHVPGRPRSEGRSQLVLDLGRAEVRDHIWGMMTTILRSAPIGFVKWDMNRHLTEVWSRQLPPHRQGEAAHRFMLGVYDLLERMHREFPEVLVEGCSGGGGRFDAGMLHYHPYIWTSDNSDAIERLRIQHGTSMVYPLSSMDANVSAIPNHQVGRRTPLTTRATVASTGAFGYQLDLLALSADERAEMRQHSERWRSLRHLFHHGDLHRLADPMTNRWAAWMCVSPARDEALVTCVRMLTEANTARLPLRLRGLDPARTYRVQVETLREIPSGGGAAHHAPVHAVFTASGSALMGIGLRVDSPGDFIASTWHLTAV
ncbi:MAG TPA: alpha-galactosidase [Planctomycetes bacterium]|nr:alpha-galactosidase [Planctomycetota bacterium]